MYTFIRPQLPLNVLGQSRDSHQHHRQYYPEVLIGVNWA